MLLLIYTCPFVTNVCQPLFIINSDVQFFIMMFSMPSPALTLGRPMDPSIFLNNFAPVLTPKYPVHENFYGHSKKKN